MTTPATLTSITDGVTLAAYCPRCGVKHLDVELLKEKLGGDFWVVSLKNKIRCRDCGSRPDTVQLVWGADIKPNFDNR